MRAPRGDGGKRGELGELEGFYIDLLSLGRRLDWTQLSELVRRTDSVRTVGEYAHLAGWRRTSCRSSTPPRSSNSADRVAAYLIRYGKAGSEDLRLALATARAP